MKKETLAVLGSVVAAAAIAFILVAKSLIADVPRDTTSLCPLSGAAGEIVVVVDKTDPWSDVQANRLKLVVQDIKRTIKANELLAIYVFNGDFTPNFEPLVSLCNPGWTASELISNPRREYEKWERNFGKPLDDKVATLTEASKGARSPIVEVMLDLLSRRELRTVTGERRMMLVSDMIQHSARASLIRGGPRETANLAAALRETKAAQGPGSPWLFDVRQIFGVYPPQQLDAAKQVWRSAAEREGLNVVWDRL